MKQVGKQRCAAIKEHARVGSKDSHPPTNQRERTQSMPPQTCRSARWETWRKGKAKMSKKLKIKVYRKAVQPTTAAFHAINAPNIPNRSQQSAQSTPHTHKKYERTRLLR